MISNVLNLWRGHRLEIAAFLVGMIILTFELAAARIVAPYLGATIFTWTSIIGVILAALAIGYALGGAWADKRQRLDDIALLLIMAAAAFVVITICKDSLLAVIGNLSWPLQVQAFIASLLLFAAPTVLLGAVTPYLARLSITDVATSGHKLSRIDAAATFGSLVGTFMTGYFLFGLIGSRYILIALALCSIGTTFLLTHKKYLYWRLGLLVAVLALGLAAPKAQLRGLIEEIDTAYNRVIIRNIAYSGEELRVLQTDNNGFQSGVYANDRPGLAFGYIRGFTYASELKPTAQAHLIIGGGAFTFPEYLARKMPRSQVDTVEIDDQLPAISREYFNFKQPANLEIVAADGRQFLNNTNRQYDTIFLDAFNSLVPPFQLLTQEAVNRMHASLQPDGLVTANIISAKKGYGSGLINYAYSTFKSNFRHVAVYAVSPDFPADQRQNLLLLASNYPIDQAALAETTRSHPEFATMTRQRLELTYRPDAILTDDYAPVEQLALW